MAELHVPVVQLPDRQGARPFYDLRLQHRDRGVRPRRARLGDDQHDAHRGDHASTTAAPPKPALADVKGIGNPHHFLAGGQGALPQNSQGRPWNGDYVFSSGDLVEDLTHNFFLETGARNGKLKVYEMVEHPAARALTGFLLVRGGVHQLAYARALELLTGADLMKLFPSPRIPTEKIPECQPHIERGEHLRLYRFSQDDYQELAAVFNGPHPETGEELVVADDAPEASPPTTCRPQPAVFAPDYAPEEIAEIAEKLRKQAGLPKQASGEVANGSRRPKPRTELREAEDESGGRQPKLARSDC